MSKSTKRVQNALQALGLACEVVTLPDSTRTAKEAAAAVGCEMAQIAKSLVFRGVQSHQPILIVTSGVNQVDEKLAQAVVGEEIARVDADFVRKHTGFAIGGVPPLGHTNPIKRFFDVDLTQYDEIWAAAGTPNAVVRLSRDDLNKLAANSYVKVQGR